MNRWSPKRAAVLVALTLALGCKKKETPLVPTDAATTTTVPASSRLLRGDLSDDDLALFYHGPEGSETLPYFLMALMKQEGGLPFDTNLDRFGLIPDPSTNRNAERLPVGVAVAVPTDLRWANLRMFGFNCAACHSTDLAAEGKTVRVIGAPGRFDARGFFEDYGRAAKPLFQSVSSVLKVLAALYNEVTRDSAHGNSGAGDTTVLAGQLLTRRLSGGPVPPSEIPFWQALDADLTKLHQMETSVEKSNAILARDPLLRRKKPVAAWPKTFAPRTLAPGLLESSHLPGTMQPLALEKKQAVARAMLEDFTYLIRMLKARVAFVAKLAGNGQQSLTRPGRGRVDAFMTFFNLVFDANVPMTSPVSYPSLWGANGLPRLHWDNNTNSIMERNLGQAIGLGAVFDPGSFDSTLLPRDIHNLEALMARMKAPVWPFEAPKPALVSRGAQVFKDENCASCHEGESKPVDVGTDPKRLTNFIVQIQGKEAVDTLADFLKKIKDRAYQHANVTETEAKAFEDGRDPAVFSRTDGYGPRSLVGVWATAPYLHNNSVPSLAALFELDFASDARKARPLHFSVNQNRYDVRNVGLEITDGNDFVTSEPGNDNHGHAYGTALSRDDKVALIEYLKTR